jgi:hypothetical protein
VRFTLANEGDNLTPPRIPRRSAKPEGGEEFTCGNVVFGVEEKESEVGIAAGRGGESAETEEVFWEKVGKGNTLVWTSTLGVTGVVLMVLGTVKDLCCAYGTEGGRSEADELGETFGRLKPRR